MTTQYGIIGYPLGHTMSPTLHNWGFGELGIDARYDAFPLEPAKLAAFMERVRIEPISGMSVTIPHKQTVMEHLDRISGRAKGVGAVNTLYWDGEALCGENTDVLGLIAPLKKLDTLPDSAMVLGAGGAARAAIVGFQELGISDIAISNRTAKKAQSLADDFSITAVDWEDRMTTTPGLICNTTPLGMAGDMEGLTPWETDRFPDDCIAYDIVYNPLETRLLREAKSAGHAVISGLEMFLHQGLAQFRLWTGKNMDEMGARQLLLKTLKA
ncbi:shikimate dehydrogenase [Pseudodesulfovibrio sp.]|nr:shikimate dehydrogenase [Pseudodesulfovibrio sp.]